MTASAHPTAIDGDPSYDEAVLRTIASRKLAARGPFK